MNREGKNVGGDLFCVAKQWISSQSGGQTKLNKDERGVPLENKLNQSSSQKLQGNSCDSVIGRLPQRTLPSSISVRKCDLTSVAKNMKSSQSVGCLQSLKAVQDLKRSDITSAIDQNNETLQKVRTDSQCCPTCGQKWQRDTLETPTPVDIKVSQWDCQPFKSTDSTSKDVTLLPAKKYKITGMKRSRSLGHKGKSQIQFHNTPRTCRVIKAASMMNDQIRSTPKHSKSKLRYTGSKESPNRSLSLTRCWSLNLDTFRIVKGDTSEDGNSINSLKAQKRFIKGGTSYENGIDSDESASCSGTEYDDIIKYSPKITKETKFVNGCPLDEFKTIFDAESFRIPSIHGQLKIMFQFFNDMSEFQVTILEGSGVAVGYKQGNLGIYTKICLTPGKIQKKTGCDKHSTRNPVFYESFIFKMSLDQLLERQLKIKLYNKPGIFSIPQPIGQCIVPLYNYDLTAVNVIWQNLNKCKGQKDEMDEFDFSFFERDRVRKRQFGRFLCGFSGQDG